MFDTFEGHQFLKKFPFTFQATRFEVWEDGELVGNGKTSGNLTAEVIQSEDNLEIVSLSIPDQTLFQEIASKITFDKVLTLNDRIILVTIPEPSSNDNVGIMSLRTTTGITRKGKIFNGNEPYCCSLFSINQKISKVTFSFSNPEKLIEFYSTDTAEAIKGAQEIDALAEQIISVVKNEDASSAREKMIKLFSVVKANPSLLAHKGELEGLGKAFVLMLNNRITSDDDTIEAIAGIAYVLVTMSILKNANPNLYMNRLLIMEFSREQFNYSIQSAIDVMEGRTISFFSPEGQMAGTKARDGIYKMEIADLYTNPALYQQIDFFKRKKDEFDEMIANNFFYNKTLADLITEGNRNHEKAYKYFHTKIIINHTIDV